MAEDTASRMKDAPAGVPRKNGTGGSFAPLTPNTDAQGFQLADAGPIVVSVGRGSFELYQPQPGGPAYPASLPPAAVTYSNGEEDGLIYIHVSIKGEGNSSAGLTVWLQDGDRCDSRDAEELGFGEDVDEALIDWAHSIRENIEVNESRRAGASLTVEAYDAIIATATGRPVTVAPAQPHIDFDQPNIDELTDEQVQKLLSAIVLRTGLVGPVINQDEAYVQLFEELGEPTTDVERELVERIDYLERKFGGKDQLARAVTETHSWEELEWTMTEALADPKKGTAAKVAEAISEIYSKY